MSVATGRRSSPWKHRLVGDNSNQETEVPYDNPTVLCTQIWLVTAESENHLRRVTFFCFSGDLVYTTINT